MVRFAFRVRVRVRVRFRAGVRLSSDEVLRYTRAICKTVTTVTCS